MSLPRATLLVLAVVLSGCPAPEVEPGTIDGGAPVIDAGAGDAGPRDAGPRDAGMPSVDAGTPGAAVTWTDCPLHSEGTGPTASCGTLLTPLDPADPNGPAIEVFVKRFRPAGGKGLRALWLLQGGPGASGYVFEGLSEQIATRFPDVDYYMPDHRGTGLSTRVGCAVQEDEGSEGGIFITPAEWPACLADVKARLGTAGLAAFNTTNAAKDLGALIAAARQPGQPTFVYGVSYGTYWAHRYLQLFPAQVDGVVFDSIFPQGGSLARQDEDANAAAKDFFDVCGADTFCAGKLGADPWAKAQALVTKLKAGHCPEIALPGVPTHVLYRRAFGSLLMDAGLRGYIPAIVYRADRCSPTDITALKQLNAALTGPQPLSLELRKWGWVLSNNIIYSELFETPTPTAAQLQAIREAAVASRDVTEPMEANLGTWPTYTPDAFARGWADTQLPLLFLQGGLDPATLLSKAREVKPHFTREHQHWVEIPTATHTTIVSSATTARRSCGTLMMMGFIENPTAPLDTSCLQMVVPIDFTLPSLNNNRALFGRDDAWE
jgi:pimeloyl-ACP methyl ester carboxylesterase